MDSSVVYHCDGFFVLFTHLEDFSVDQTVCTEWELSRLSSACYLEHQVVITAMLVLKTSVVHLSFLAFSKLKPRGWGGGGGGM